MTPSSHEPDNNFSSSTMDQSDSRHTNTQQQHTPIDSSTNTNNPQHQGTNPSRQGQEQQQPNPTINSLNSMNDIHTNDTSTTHSSSSLLSTITNSVSQCCSLLSFNQNPEARGIALDHVPGGVISIALSVFLSSAIMELANEAAGCPTTSIEEMIIDDLVNELQEEECNNRVYGMKPSSLLTVYVFLMGLTSSIFMPFVGSMIDCSNHRRGVGAVTAAIIMLITFLSTFLSSNNWFFILILVLICSIILNVHYCVVLAYLPELTTDEDELTRYNAGISLCFNLSIVVFLVGMTLVSTVLKMTEDTIVCTRIAMLVAFVVQFLAYGYAWTRLFRPRPARIDISEDEEDSGNDNANRKMCRGTKCRIVQVGFQRLLETIQKVSKERTELKWCLIARAFTQSASLALAAATITYLTDDIQLSQRDLGISLLIILACAIPGNQLSIVLSRMFNPLNSLRLCFVVFAALVTAFVAFIYEPEQEMRVFLLSIVWGFVIGWKEPTEKTLFCHLVPRGHEGEIGGLYIFASQILTWLPPLIMTVMNESGIPMRVALASIGGYFFLGLLSLLKVGDYDTAIANVKQEEMEELREGRRIATDPTASDEEMNVPQVQFE